LDAKLRDALLFIKSQKDIKVEVPGFVGDLEPHQRVGVAFAVMAKKCLVLDFVGAGKTVEAIATDLKLRSIGEVHRSLVVCQGGKRGDWKDEYKQFSSLPTYVVDGNKAGRVNAWLAGQNDYGVTIAHYEAVRGDFLDRRVGERGRPEYGPSALSEHLRYDFIIFDEVSIFKSWESVLADSLRCLVDRNPSAAKMGLSATPVQKTLEDLHSIMDKILPGLLGSRPEFEANYCIKKQFETFTGSRRSRFTKVIGYNNVDGLANIMNPYFIRREKQQVYGDQKLKHVKKLRRVEMTASQLKKYKELAASVSDGDVRGSLLQVFAQMEKVCDTMNYFDDDDHTSAKIDDLRFLLTNDLKEEKVVIFSKHHKPLFEIAGQILEPEEIPYIRYTGKEDLATREADRHRFLNDPSVRVALITTAAEMGFNFHSAHYMIFFNHIYNQARIEQIIGRIDRPIVQKSNFICTIHYAAKDTHEEKIIPRFQKDAQLMTKLFGATNKFDGFTGDVVEKLSTEALLTLIRTGHLKVDQDEFLEAR
jgi:SNF2 family DNA or RNA helicase